MPTGHYRFRRSLGNVGSLFRGARPDTYPLFSGLLDQYVGAAAAYSLRALAASWLRKDVVEVRRASDNISKGFTEKEITDGAMVDWVNETVELPLDTASGAAAAYSLRNLSASYTGNVADVRRSSDDTEDSFTAAEVADGTLVTWVGAGNDGFVTQWYDQSGNVNHATQGTDASQPKIVDAGSLVSGGLDFDGVDDSFDVANDASLQIIGDMAQFVVINPDSLGSTGGASRAIVSKYSSDLSREFEIRNELSDIRYLDSNNSELFSGSIEIGNTSLISTLRDANTSVNVAEDGSLGTPAALSGTQASTTEPMLIGARSGTFNWDGQIAELIIYNSDQSGNRPAIESNIASHYSITLPTGSNPGSVDGFVSTWYDQSGNANNAVQATSTSQPKIVDAGVLVTDDDGKVAINGKSSTLDLPSNAPMLSSDGTYSLFSVVDLPDQTLGSDSFNDVIRIESIGLGGASDVRKPLISLAQVDGLTRLSTPSNPLGTASLTDLETVGVRLLTNIANPALPTGNNTAYADGVLASSVDDNTDVNASTSTGANCRLFDLAETTVETFLSEVIYYPSDQSANRVAIETNINTKYSIY